MKIYKPLIPVITLLSLFIAPGCNNLLDEEPEDRIILEQLYNTDEDLTNAAYGIYNPFLEDNNYRRGRIMYLLGMRTDEVKLSDDRIGEASVLDLATFNMNTDNRFIRDAWRLYYNVINRANIMIERAPDAESASQGVKSRVIAEAYLVRAFCYFNLVRLWGDVPLQLSFTASIEGARLPRTSAETVYAQIIEDLRHAAGEIDTDVILPTVSGNTDQGRVTLSSAHTLLADVYLTLGNFAQAEEYARRVMDSGLHGLWPNYGDVFSIASQYDELPGAPNAESIFQLSFDPDRGIGSRFATQTFPRDQILPFAAQASRVGEGFFDVDESSFNAFDPADLRRNYIFPDSLVTGSGSDSPLPARDTLVTFSGQTVVFNEEEPYFILKYRADDPTNRFQWGSNPWPLYRYAEILLIYAEAIVEQRTPSQAELDESVNRLRARAGLSAIITASGQEGIRQAIRDERYAELYFEGKRFFDLVRWGELVNTINNRDFGYPIGNTIDERYELLPIPLEEISTNPDIGENNPPWN